MSASGDDGAVSRLRSVASIRGGSLENVIAKSLLLPVVAFFAGIADIATTLTGVPVAIGEALGVNLADLVDATIGGGARVVGAGASQSAQSLTQGVWSQFGPATLVIAVGVVGGAAYVAARIRSVDETGNFGIVGFLPSDIPIFGQDEDEEE